MPQVRQRRAASPSVIDKRILAGAINDIIRTRNLTQTEAARVVRDAPSQLSLISTGKLDGFSPDRLVRILTRLGRDVELRITKSRGSAGKVRVQAKR